MKVLMLNGSAKANGNTYRSLLEVGKQLEKEYENFFSNMYEYNWTKFNK